MASIVYGEVPPTYKLQTISKVEEQKDIGLSLPIGTDGKLFSKSSSNELLIGQIKQILFTTPGERVMLPRFGIDLNSFLFEQLTPELIEKIKDIISTQIESYVNNCKIISLNVTQSLNEDPFNPVATPSINVQMQVANQTSNQILPLEFTI